MSDVRRPLLALLFVLLAAGCAGSSPDAVPGARQPSFTACRDPRPELCTREYRPVCARLREEAPGAERSGSGAERWVTRPNACVACSDDAVEGYRPGRCEDAPEEEGPQQRLEY